MIFTLLGVPGKLKTIGDRLSATWAAKLDALRTGLTDARMGYLDKLNITGAAASAADVTSATSTLSTAIAGRLGSIKAIYSGNVIVTCSATNTGSGTATIAAVVTAKTLLIKLGVKKNSANSEPLPMSSTIELTNSTTLTAVVNLPAATGSSQNYSVGYLVVEFN